jgi:hypothetical protein
MSGKKQYHVDMSKWFRDRVRRSMVSFLLPGVLEAVGAQQDADVQRNLEALREQQRRQADLLASFSERTKQREEAIGAMFAQQMSELEERVRQEGSDTRADLMEAMAAQERRWRAELSREQEARWQQIAGIEADVKQLLDDRAAAQAAAARWLADAEAERALIAETIPQHERYGPGELVAIERRLSTAGQNVQAGQFEAAIATAQQAYHDLSDLRVELMLRHREWTELRWQAGRALSIVRELIQRGARLPGSSIDELTSDAQIDVDHWSEGKLKLLADQVANVSAELGNETDPPAIDRIREIVSTQAPEFRRQIEDAIELAQRRVEASQLRVNIADLVISVLEDRFAYEYQDGGYQAGDQRTAFVARLDRIGGNSVVVELRPAGADFTDAELDILSYDGTTESMELRQARGQAIYRSLSEGDFASSSPRDLGEPDPALRELPSLAELPAPGRLVPPAAGESAGQGQ